MLFTKSTNKRFFCTYFDINFSGRGLALYNSLKENSQDFTLYVLALDKEINAYLTKLNLDNLEIINLDDYIAHFSIDINRFEDKKQFYFSITANICLYVLHKNPFIDILSYIDADIRFYNTVEYLYEDLGSHSIGICKHNFSALNNMILSHYGEFNVGINVFRNDTEGVQCLEKWKEDCDSWRADDPNNFHPFFSDQIMLDEWPKIYKNLKIFDNQGISAAPWNIGKYKISIKNGHYFLDEYPLVAFHFSSLVKIEKETWNAVTSRYLTTVKKKIKDIYVAYINDIERLNARDMAVVKLNFQQKFVSRVGQKMASVFFNQIIKVKQ